MYQSPNVTVHRTDAGRLRPITVLAHFADAQDVFLLGRFNGWSTVATPMRDLGRGRWVVSLHEPVDPTELSFFVWQHGERFGRVVRSA